MGLLTLTDCPHDNMAGRSLSAVALVLFFAAVQCQRFPGRGANRGQDNARVETAGPCEEKVMDLYFVLDSSNSIYVHDYDSELDFVRGVVARLDISSRFTRVGMLTFSDDFTRPTISLSQFNTKTDVLNAVALQNWTDQHSPRYQICQGGSRIQTGHYQGDGGCHGRRFSFSWCHSSRSSLGPGRRLLFVCCWHRTVP